MPISTVRVILTQTYSTHVEQITDLQRPGPKNEPIVAFPQGLKMIAGSAIRRTYDPTNFSNQAVSFVCLDYNGNHSNDPPGLKGRISLVTTVRTD